MNLFKSLTYRVLVVSFLLAGFLFSSLAAAANDSLNSLISRSDAVFLGRVNGSVSYLRKSDSAIMTDYSVTPESAVLGQCAETVKIVQHGGAIDDTVTWPHHLSADIQTGKTYLFFLERRDDQTLAIVDGPSGVMSEEKANAFFMRILQGRVKSLGHEGSDIRDQSAANLEISNVVSKAVTSNGLGETPYRFSAQDSGGRIPVIVDNSTRPSGISASQAMTLIGNALAAWESATSLRFKIVGTEVFTGNANTDAVSPGDGAIRIQMHDNFNLIPNSSTTAGVGGAFYSGTPVSGGIVSGVNFRRTTNGYVIIDHAKSFNSNVTNLEALLTHEIGHAIGLAHSSETSPEPNTNLAQSIMYFQSPSDGRGAQLNNYDITTARKVNPLGGIPATMTRRISVVTIPGDTLANPEVNQVVLHNLGSASVTGTIVEQTNYNGTFTISGNTVTFEPFGFFSDNEVSKEDGFFDKAVVTVSDGTNSGAVEIRVVTLFRDANSDGLPDSWVTDNFGSATVGIQPSDDPDNDGFTNLEEFQLGTDPDDNQSYLKITNYTAEVVGTNSVSSLTWDSADCRFYKIESSVDLTTWQPVQFVESQGLSTTANCIEETLQDARYYRVQRLK